MRNLVIHPTRSRRNRWTREQWTEAHILAVHFLELAVLAYVGTASGITRASAATAGLGTPRMSRGPAAEPPNGDLDPMERGR